MASERKTVAKLTEGNFATVATQKSFGLFRSIGVPGKSKTSRGSVELSKRSERKGFIYRLNCNSLLNVSGLLTAALCNAFMVFLDRLDAHFLLLKHFDCFYYRTGSGYSSSVRDPELKGASSYRKRVPLRLISFPEPPVEPCPLYSRHRTHVGQSACGQDTQSAKAW